MSFEYFISAIAVSLTTIQVGFSYSDDKEDYNTDDSRTASDNVAALLAFMNKFPEHSSNNLYLTGES